MPALTEHDVRMDLLPAPGKSCGGCTACCYTVPVQEIGLKSFHRCPLLNSPPHVKTGCSIYERRPSSCRGWSCVWLVSDSLPDELRPDRCGVVIDPIPDMATLGGQKVPAAQFWVLRGFEEAWQTQPVKGLIEKTIKETNFIVLWRMAPDAEGRLWTMAFFRGPNGKVLRSEPHQPTEDLFGLDTPNRLGAAQELIRNQRGR